MEFGKKVQLGNFIVVKTKKEYTVKGDDGKKKKASLEFIKASAADGYWSIEYREDSIMFRLIDDAINDKASRNAFEHIFVNAFAISSVIPDEQFLKEFAVSINALIERNAGEIEPVSDEEDKEIIQKMKMQYEDSKELN